MGLDFLDFAFSIEKRLQMRLNRKHLGIDQHTTVADVVELLWRHLQGWELKEDLDLIGLYVDLHTRIMRKSAQGYWSAFFGKNGPQDRRMDDVIPPDRRRPFLEELSRDMNCPLPPLETGAGEIDSCFPEAIATQRRLLHLLRGHLFQRLKWVPILPPVVNETLPKPSIGNKFVQWTVCGRWPQAPESAPVRETPWTREELFEIVRQALVETLDVDPNEVTPDAELMDHLGME